MKTFYLLLIAAIGLVGCFHQPENGVKHGSHESEESIEYMAEFASDLSEHVYDDSGFISVTACETPKGIPSAGTGIHTVNISNCTDDDGNSVSGVLHIAWNWTDATNGTFDINSTSGADSYITVSGILDVGLSMTAEFSGIEVHVVKTDNTKTATAAFAATWEINGHPISFTLETITPISLNVNNDPVSGVVEVTDNNDHKARVTFIPGNKIVTFY